jgi:predicted DNA-binding protein (UPF0278 family)
MEYQRWKTAMTTITDVIRQIETTMHDKFYPPTLTQKEVMTFIMHRVNNNPIEYKVRQLA